MSGKLFCVGLGPGDPELIAVKADRLIRNARVIVYPAPVGGASFARSIAAGLIHPDAEEIPMEIPMEEEQFLALNAYTEAAVTISARLEQGSDVVVLCQGDPFFYGSFIYLFERIDQRFTIEVVPGVTSMTACAAAALQPLCGRRETLTILPALLPEEVLAEKLATPGPFVIVKVGRNIGKIRKILDRLNRLDRSVFVSHASLENERIVPMPNTSDSAPYFSTVIVPGSNLFAV